MKNSFFKFRYYSGKQAISLYWIDVLDFQGELSSVPKLELIINENTVIIAIRFHSSAEDKFIKGVDKGWKFTEAGESYNPQEKRDLDAFIAINSEAELYHYSYN